ncbi:hypothetical protein EP7_002908 [Isosphaeraceae bacterium EP7]
MDTIEVSQKRIDANRRNAMRSTGPKTAEGKEKSRRNSLIHGLAATVVVPEGETQAARDRAEQWNSSLRPVNAFEMCLVETIAVESLRIERCRIEERLVRDTRARRATTCWADERKADAAKLGRSLPGRPDEVAARLAATAPGCDWMIDRWRALGHALDKTGTWTDAQQTMALDLMGIAADLRDLNPPTEAAEGVNPLDHLQELVDDQLERLWLRKQETLDDIEADHREAATMGLSTVDDKTLVLLRRYETASFRRMRWALALMQKGQSRPNAQAPNPKWDDSEPAWKGNSRIRVETFPAPHQYSPETTAERSHSAGAERTHLDPTNASDSTWIDPFGLAARLASQVKTATDPAPQPTSPAPAPDHHLQAVPSGRAHRAYEAQSPS